MSYGNGPLRTRYRGPERLSDVKGQIARHKAQRRSYEPRKGAQELDRVRGEPWAERDIDLTDRPSQERDRSPSHGR